MEFPTTTKKNNNKINNSSILSNEGNEQITFFDIKYWRRYKTILAKNTVNWSKYKMFSLYSCNYSGTKLDYIPCIDRWLSTIASSGHLTTCMLLFVYYRLLFYCCQKITSWLMVIFKFSILHAIGHQKKRAYRYTM